MWDNQLASLDLSKSNKALRCSNSKRNRFHDARVADMPDLQRFLSGAMMVCAERCQ